jgi:Trypsin-like peptidase domain
MFSSALQKVSKYTLPVIISRRLESGRVTCSCGSFIVLNPEGWILTAGHVVGDLPVFQAHQKEIADYKAKKREIESDPSLPDKRKRKLTARLPQNPDWITNISFFWGIEGVTIKQFRVNQVLDLATGKLDPFDASKVQEYPIFKNPQEGLLPGTSLCRLGFPFQDVTATFDQATNQFALGSGVLPVAFFPNDGIHTRVVTVNSQNNQKAKFIETSSPGLLGQSGGPIFDSKGHIWAIQVRTQHLRLGFTPKVREGNREVTEHQFMHVGWGTHIEEIIGFLRANNVSFNLSS